MNEVTPPKKPLLYYYTLALLGLMLFTLPSGVSRRWTTAPLWR